MIGQYQFDGAKNIFIHPDPDSLLQEYAGTGVRVKKQLGEWGYVERVNFYVIIGFHIDKDTKKRTPTTWGDIHYSKNGAHIVPALGEP